VVENDGLKHIEYNRKSYDVIIINVLLMDVVFTSGAGKIGLQSLYLSRSIRLYGNFDRSFVYIPESELPDLDNCIVSELREHHSLLFGEIPIEDYPISAKIQGMATAQEQGESGYTVLLDSDTIVLNNIKLGNNHDAELFAAPVNVAIDRYWTSSNSEADWQKFYHMFGIEPPERTVTTVIDKQRIKPYYNAGVVIARNGFAKKWLDWTEEVFYHASNSKRNADQVALGLLSEKIDTCELDKNYNYPVHFVRYPNSICVLHYFNLNTIVRVTNPEIREKINRIGAYDAIELNPTLKSMLFSSHGYTSVFRSKIGRFLKRLDIVPQEHR